MTAAYREEEVTIKARIYDPPLVHSHYMTGRVDRLWYRWCGWRTKRHMSKCKEGVCKFWPEGSVRP